MQRWYINFIFILQSSGPFLHRGYSNDAATFSKYCVDFSTTEHVNPKFGVTFIYLHCCDALSPHLLDCDVQRTGLTALVFWKPRSLVWKHCLLFSNYPLSSGSWASKLCLLAHLCVADNTFRTEEGPGSRPALVFSFTGKDILFWWLRKVGCCFSTAMTTDWMTMDIFKSEVCPLPLGMHTLYRHLCSCRHYQQSVSILSNLNLTKDWCHWSYGCYLLHLYSKTFLTADHVLTFLNNWFYSLNKHLWWN